MSVRVRERESGRVRVGVREAVKDSVRERQ